MTVPYICAQRIIHLARDAQAFHMLSRHIARQALNLVVLLNDSIDADAGPNFKQQEESIELSE